jgi:hypothetical protein
MMNCRLRMMVFPFTLWKLLFSFDGGFCCQLFDCLLPVSDSLLSRLVACLLVARRKGVAVREPEC